MGSWCVSVWPLDDCATMEMMTVTVWERLLGCQNRLKLLNSLNAPYRYDTSSRSILQTPRFRGGIRQASSLQEHWRQPWRPHETPIAWPFWKVFELTFQTTCRRERTGRRTDGHPASFEEYLADFQAMWGMGYIHKANKLYRSRCLSFSVMFHCCSNISHSSEETPGIPQISSAVPSRSFLLVNLSRIYIVK